MPKKLYFRDPSFMASWRIYEVLPSSGHTLEIHSRNTVLHWYAQTNSVPAHFIHFMELSHIGKLRAFGACDCHVAVKNGEINTRLFEISLLNLPFSAEAVLII